jgi:UDP-N-acetylmuramate dehydrogenase
MVADEADPDSRSVGSFFTNPVLTANAFERLRADWSAQGGGAVPSFPAPDGVKVPAAWLVEQAGFAKGYRRGGARVSTKHTLALVNAGGTTADLLALAEEIVQGVAARFGIRLEREPVELGTP